LKILKNGDDPEKFIIIFKLQIRIPPEGGFAIGLERVQSKFWTGKISAKRVFFKIGADCEKTVFYAKIQKSKQKKSKKCTKSLNYF